jgi:hypothetical protein
MTWFCLGKLIIPLNPFNHHFSLLYNIGHLGWTSIDLIGCILMNQQLEFFGEAKGRQDVQVVTFPILPEMDGSIGRLRFAVGYTTVNNKRHSFE